MPGSKPQQLQRGNLNLWQPNCWYRSMLLCVGRLGPRRRLGFSLCHCCWSWPLLGPIHPFPNSFHTIHWAYLLQLAFRGPPGHMGKLWYSHWHASNGKGSYSAAEHVLFCQCGSSKGSGYVSRMPSTSLKLLTQHMSECDCYSSRFFLLPRQSTILSWNCGLHKLTKMRRRRCKENKKMLLGFSNPCCKDLLGGLKGQHSGLDSMTYSM